MKIWQLFYTFFEIGLFTFGGGYAMIPLIQDMVAKRGWCDLQTLVDFIAVSESTPGAFAINIATFIGIEKSGVLGAIASTLGVILPSFLIILLIAKNIERFENNTYVKSVMQGLRPVVVGMIGAAAASVMQLALVTSQTNGIVQIDFNAVVIFVLIMVMSRAVKKIHPILLIAFSAVFGIVLYGLL